MRYPFDARGVAKRFRHAAIFGALDSLNPGETMLFVNDHDPLPLLAQLFERALALALLWLDLPTDRAIPCRRVGESGVGREVV